MRLLYNLLFPIGLSIWLPFALWKKKNAGKYQNSLPYRLGRGLNLLEKKKSKLIWVHAVSFGETRAVAPFAKKLFSIYQDKENGDVELVTTSVTETGLAEAKRAFPYASNHLFLPFDLPHLSEKFIEKLKPDVVILSETDYWYNFLSKAKTSGAKIAVVNGKLSKKSADRLKYVKGFAKSLFSFVDLFCCQEEIYQERLIASGAVDSKTVVTGNLKYDFTPPRLSVDELQSFRQKLGIQEGDIALVVGSTHPGEEEIVLETWKKLLVKFPNLKLILVPRHPERFALVENRLKELQINYQTYLAPKEGRVDCTLVNAMGVLMNCYQAADLAVVGGSLVPGIGGHNIIEPCAYDVPSLFGPFMENQPEMVQLVLKYGAGKKTSALTLQEDLAALLNSKETRLAIGKNGSRLISDQTGTVDRTIKALGDILSLNAQKK